MKIVILLGGSSYFCSFQIIRIIEIGFFFFSLTMILKSFSNEKEYDFYTIQMMNIYRNITLRD